MINIQKINKYIKKLTKIYGQYRFLIILLILLTAPSYFYWIFIYSTPDLRSLKGYYPNLVTEVYSSDGILIGEYAVNNRKLIPFNEIPDHVKNAFIAVEDQRFYEHKGIDMRSIFAAIVDNIRAVDWVRGASTITQQVSKNLSLSFEKSLSRKVKEAVIAYRMENYLTKDEILYIYLNHIYLADGVYGIEAASQNYFGKSASSLNLAEAALLAGLPRRPEYYSPRKHLKISLERQRIVLEKMQEQGYIDEDQKMDAINHDIKIKPKDRLKGDIAPYFTEMVKQFVKEKYGEDYFLKGGLKIFTSIDVDLSLEADWSLKRGLIEVNERHNSGIVLKNIREKEQITNFLLSQNIKNISIGNTYEGVILGTKKISFGLYSATVAVGLLRANLFYSTERNYRNNTDSIEEHIINQYPFLSGFDAVNIVPNQFNAGDVINVKVTAKSGKDYYCNLDYDTNVQGALISIDRNGYIKALVGGYDFSKSQFNRAIQAHRQPGSVFKPIVYAAALDKGYTQISVLSDTPVSIGNWKPANYDSRYLGRIPLRQALVKSRNLATVNLIQAITPKYVVEYAGNFGFSSQLHPYPSLALGSSVVTVEEVACAFSVFANGGRLNKPKFIYRIYDREGNILFNNIKISSKNVNNNTGNSAKLNPEEFIEVLRNKKNKQSIYSSSNHSISEETAYIITDILKAVIVEGTGSGARPLNRLSPVAGKTGTTNDYTDAWFAGYSPYLTTVVWVGKDDNATIGSGEPGSKAALPIWFDFMSDALTKYPHNDFSQPEKIEYINTNVGRLAFREELSPRRKLNDSYVSSFYKIKNNKKQKTVGKMKDIKKILKDAFLLPNP